MSASSASFGMLRSQPAAKLTPSSPSRSGRPPEPPRSGWAAATRILPAGAARAREEEDAGGAGARRRHLVGRRLAKGALDQVEDAELSRRAHAAGGARRRVEDRAGRDRVADRPGQPAVERDLGAPGDE